MNRKAFSLTCGFLMTLLGAQAAISITGTGTFNYTQNFDSLASTGTGIAWANDSTLSGWSLFNKTPAAVTTYIATNGSINTGSFYSLGSVGATDRALGGVASGGSYFGSPSSGTVAGWIALSIGNNSGTTIGSFTLGFNGEQWRDGGNATPVAQTMSLEYGFGSTFTTVSSWIAPGGAFNWASPVFTTTAGAVDGNVAGLVSGVGGTINSLTWADGETLWVRWAENNDAGNDHGLAIDNFSFTAEVTPVPEPSTFALLGMAGLLFAVLRGQRK